MSAKKWSRNFKVKLQPSSVGMRNRGGSSMPNQPNGRTRAYNALDADGFQMIPNVILNDIAGKKLRHEDIGVYMAFKSFQRENGYSWPANGTVAHLCGMSTSTLSRCISRLVGAGHLERRFQNAGGTMRTCILTLVREGH